MLFTPWPVQVWCLTSMSTPCRHTKALPSCWIHTPSICVRDPSGGSPPKLTLPSWCLQTMLQEQAFCHTGVALRPPLPRKGELVASLGRVLLDRLLCRRGVCWAHAPERNRGFWHWTGDAASFSQPKARGREASLMQVSLLRAQSVEWSVL